MSMGRRSYKGRWCSRFYCDEVGERRCCADCWRKKQNKCQDACQNHPSRCGLENRKEQAE